jgi:phosphoribosylformimino-5-aminoimidazole carboxamide ribotide isomerase
MQILPAIDIRGGKCVRLRQGDYDRETVFSDDPVEMAKRFFDQGAERLHLVDLDGARAGHPVNVDVISRIVASVSIPCQLGGGLRTEEGLATILETLGVDRAIVGTQALKQPDWFREMTARFPGRIALGIDARDSKVATGGWLEVSETPAIELAKSYVGLDLAALIYTNIANDGMMQGIDDATISDMVELADLGFRVIASGGVSRLVDVRKLAATSRTHPNLVGAIIGRALYEGSLTVADAIAAAG